MTPDEALSEKLLYEFQRYYAKHCERLGQPVDGPLARLHDGDDGDSIFEPADASSKS